MIFANIAPLLLGLVISALATNVYYAQRIRTMKRDAKSALSAEAQDWYRRGYMRGMIDEKDENYQKEKTQIIYQPLNV